MKKTWNCSECKWFGEDGICDMCGFGYPYSVDNNGLTPKEVKNCNAYVYIDKEIKYENQ